MDPVTRRGWCDRSELIWCDAGRVASVVEAGSKEGGVGVVQGEPIPRTDSGSELGVC